MEILLAVMLTLCGTISATAQTKPSTQFYVVQDQKTKECMVVDKKPSMKLAKIVGDATYRTQVEAEKGMKIIKVCISR